MDLKTSRIWVSQPDACRCCLTARGSWDLTLPYVNNGVKEVFQDMLLESFGITLSLLNKGRNRLACDGCIEVLRSAHRFKLAVMDADQAFVKFHGGRDVLDQESRVPRKSDAEDDDDDAANDDTDIVPFDHQPIPMENIKIEENESFSDPGESSFSEKNNEKNGRTSNKATIAQKGTEHEKCAKPLSERKRLTLTCQTVLSHTSAAPFRHHKSWFRCLFCVQEFTDMNDLRNHLTSHRDVNVELKKLTSFPKSLQIDISDFKCRICNEELKDVDYMCEHMLKVHNKVVFKEHIADFKVNASPYTCHICGAEFHVFRSLSVHMNEHYANLVCEECGKCFINTKRLQVHKRTHEIGQFTCKVCDRVLLTRTGYVNHLETHTNRVLKCQICSLPMKHYNDRVRHMSEVHNVTHSFKCKFCPKVFNIKHYLATHMRQTHGTKDKMCSQCDMTFITSHSLKKHMSTHAKM